MMIEGHDIDPRTARCVTSNRIVARSRARRWLSFTRKISADGFHVTTHKTKTAAVDFGSIYAPNPRS